MTISEAVKWNLFKIAGVIVGIIVAAFWLGIGLILAFGFTGVLGAILIFTLVTGGIGVFLIINFFWLTYAVLRVGDSIERIEERLSKKQSR